MVITEIGGTVGDIESLPFLEAIRQFALDVGKDNCLYIHLTLVPYLKAAGELKTKPTQHSVGQLRQIGIQPDILICRTERESDRATWPRRSPCSATSSAGRHRGEDKDFSIYEVPLSLVENQLDELIVEKLDLPASRSTSSDWRDLLHRLREPDARNHHRRGGQVHRASRRLQVDLRGARPRRHRPCEPGRASARSRARTIEREGAERLLGGVDGMLVPGGFGDRGIEGKIDAIRFAREREIPFFGICLGMQCAVDRVRPQRRRPGRTPTPPSSTATPPSGDLPARRAVHDHRQGRHDAAGHLPVRS